MIDFKNIKKVYFIGIGGISMSAIALILKNNNIEVLGSDINHSEITDRLINNGIKVNFDQVEENITTDIDLVVYTAAIHQDNKEYIAANKLGLNIVVRSKLLGELMKLYKNNINVAGTHGKTTTTSMIAKILIDANLNPTINVGAVYKFIDGNVKIGSNEIFLNEACEYTNSFLDFNPNVEIITNIEEDHLDFFKDINDIRASFKKYIDKLDSNGLLIINNKIKNLNELFIDSKANIKTYSSSDCADFETKNIIVNNVNTTFDIYYNDKFIINISIKVFGNHNVENALAAFACCYLLGIDPKIIKDSLFDFSGADRRLENKGEYNGILIYDDYAHHPSEIKASINALKSLNNQNKKVYLIFQPHTFTRTKLLFNEFCEALSNIDNLIIIDIYPAREKDIYNISSKDLVDFINKKYNKNAKYISNIDDTVKYLLDNIKPDNIVITMGAGDVYKISDKIIEYFNNK